MSTSSISRSLSEQLSLAESTRSLRRLQNVGSAQLPSVVASVLFVMSLQLAKSVFPRNCTSVGLNIC